MKVIIPFLEFEYNKNNTKWVQFFSFMSHFKYLPLLLDNCRVGNTEKRKYSSELKKLYLIHT